MKQFLLCTMALVALVATVRAEDEKKTSDSYQSLLAEYSKEQRAALTAYRAANIEERQARLGEYRQVPGKYVDRFLKFAEANADDSNAYDALVWVVSNDQQGKYANKAIPVIVAKHLDNPKIVQLCQRLSRSPSSAAKTLLQAVIDSSKNVDAKGHATYGLAKAMLGRSGKRNEKAEALLTTVIEKYGDAANGSLAKSAKKDLFELQHLSVGCEAPAIKSEDIDGVEFTLADYRGKVVVLDFWGDW